jgi:cytochrome P450
MAAISRPVPHPKDFPVLGSVPAFVRDTPQTFLDGWREVGDIVRFRGLRSMCLIVHPDFVKHVLEDNSENYRRSDSVNDALTMLLGESTFTARGDDWRRRARLVHPLLAPERVAGFSEHVAAAAAETAARWDRSAAAQPLDLYDEMRTTCIDAAARILFGAGRGGDFGRFLDAVTTANEYVIAKTMAVGGPPDVRIRPAYRRYLRAVADLDTIVARAVAERRGTPSDDLVSALVSAGDESGRLSDSDVRNEVLTYVLGVYSGVVSALMWVLPLLSEREEVRRRLADELGGQPATLESTSGLEYLGRVIDETLRLYPSFWVYALVGSEADQIGGYDIPAGLSVVISPYMTHRHPDFWNDPEAFDPDRFTADRSAGRHPYAYFPFSGGPRGCPAGEPARAMIRIALAALAPRYRVTRVPGHTIKRRREFVLRPANGLPVTVEPVH